MNKFIEKINQNFFPGEFDSLKLSVISLESKSLIFPKLLARKHRNISFNFYIPEHNIKVFNGISRQTNKAGTLKGLPNCFLLISYGKHFLLRRMKPIIDVANLDFCCTFKTAKPTLMALRPVLKNCKVLAVTVCKRNGGSFPRLESEYKSEIEKIFPYYDIQLYSYKDENHAKMIAIHLVFNQEKYKKAHRGSICNKSGI